MLDHGHDKYITTRELEKLRTGNFAVGSVQTELATRDNTADFAKKAYVEDKLKKISKKKIK